MNELPKWRPRIQSEYSVVNRDGEIVTAREIIKTLGSLEAELERVKKERDELQEKWTDVPDEYENWGDFGQVLLVENDYLTLERDKLTEENAQSKKKVEEIDELESELKRIKAENRSLQKDLTLGALELGFVEAERDTLKKQAKETTMDKLIPLNGKQLRAAIAGGIPVRYVAQPRSSCASRIDEVVIVTNRYIGEITDIDPDDEVVWECTGSEGGDEGLYFVKN